VPFFQFHFKYSHFTSTKWQLIFLAGLLSSPHFSLVRSLEESDETESQISAYRDLPYSMAKWIPIEYLSHFITSILFNAFTAGLRINSTSILDATDSAPDAAAAEELKKGRKNRRNKRQQRNQRQQQMNRNLVILQEEVGEE
jgi:hypothetical protein